jgi:hypothetical protein
MDEVNEFAEACLELGTRSSALNVSTMSPRESGSLRCPRGRIMIASVSPGKSEGTSLNCPVAARRVRLDHSLRSLVPWQDSNLQPAVEEMARFRRCAGVRTSWSRATVKRKLSARQLLDIRHVIQQERRQP